VASTDQTVTGVPGRYASALFDLAKEEKSVDSVQAQLAAFRAAIEGSADLKRMVTSPVFTSADQIAAIDAICAKAKITGTSLNFLRLVVKNRRLPALPAIIDAFDTLVAISKGEIGAEVISADKLSAVQLKDLKAALKASTGRDVTLSTRVDSSLLGGLIVKVGSRMMDNSLKTKLQNLKIAMKGTA
jgi:F-type H+-transporting ATPase subunit delta